MDEVQDRELIERVLSGESALFSVLLSRYQSRVLACSVAILRNREDAVEMTQETFIRLYNNLNQFDASRPLAPYIMRIAVNICRDFLRRKARNGRYEELSDAIVENCPDFSLSPDRAIMAEEKAAFAARILDSLPVRFREVCSLFYLSGHSCSEVSEILEISETSVKVILHRARKKMHETINRGLAPA